MTAGAAPSAPPVPTPVPTTLVIGAGPRAREAAIAAEVAAELATESTPSSSDVAVILEGIAAGDSALDESGDKLQLARIAPGCLCCTGNVVLRVTLNRLLRQRPRRLFIGVARSEHLDQLRSWLQAEPYDQLLRLTPDLQATEAR